MKYKPVRKTAEEILEYLGFKPVSIGYALYRIKRTSGGVLRVHAIIEKNGKIHIHEDYIVDGKHKARKGTDGLRRFIAIFRAVDRGKGLNLNEGIFRKYYFAIRKKRKKRGWYWIYDRKNKY